MIWRAGYRKDDMDVWYGDNDIEGGYMEDEIESGYMEGWFFWGDIERWLNAGLCGEVVMGKMTLGWL